MAISQVSQQVPTSSQKEYGAVPEPKSRHEEPHQLSERVGYVLVFLSAVLFCSMFLLMRSATAYHGVSVSAVVFLRGVLQIVLAFAIAPLFSERLGVFSVPRHLLPLLFARGVFGATSLLLSYYSISLVPLGIESTLFFTNPVFTIALSGLVLHEVVSAREIAATGICIIGAIMVSNPSAAYDLREASSPGYIVGALAALASALLSAVAYVCIRSLGTQIHFMASVMAFAVLEMLLGSAMGGFWLRGSALGLWITVAACVVGFAGQCLFCKGMQHCRAGTGSVIRTVDVPLAFVLGLVFLGEVPHFFGVCGSILIVTGVLIIGVGGASAQKIDPEDTEV